MEENLPATLETQVQFLGQEDPLEKGMVTHFSNLAWENLWTEEPGGLQSMGSKKVRHGWAPNEWVTYHLPWFRHCCSVTQSCLILCDPMDYKCQASLSFTISQSLLKLRSIESMMLSNHFIQCCSLLLLSSIFPSIRAFSNESALHIRWPKYWSFSFSINPSKEYSGLIPFRMDWFALLAVQTTLKSLLQPHSLKASLPQRSAFMVQLSQPYVRASLIAQLVKNLPAMQDTPVWSLGWEDPRRRALQSTLVFSPGESHGQRSLAGQSQKVRRDWSVLACMHAQRTKCRQKTRTLSFMDQLWPYTINKC